MNANELADDMENGAFNDANYNKKKAAYFVRQQQAEIEALKKEAALQRLSDFTQEAEKTLTEDTECQYCKQGCIRCDARKLLTDEEILDVEKRLRNNGDFCELHFARAILRKAQNEQ